MTVRDALDSGYSQPIRDALWGHIYLTPQLEALTRTEPFMRLHRIAQLGPAELCYPGATHTRAAHCIGVYHISRRLLANLAERGADSWLSAVGVRSMLCAALLHDIGHFPYAHSLKELPLADHESLGAEIILSEPVHTLVGKAGADPSLTAAIVDPFHSSGDSEELRFYRKLLSGTLDPDKLDYLNRDARYCGVPYGAQDVDYIISILHPNRERGVDIDSRGITSVESVLFSKYLMYRSVYWHRSVRSATAMVKKALYAGLRDGVLAAGDLYNLDDSGLFALCAARGHPLFSLLEAVRQGRLYMLASELPFDESLHGDIARIETRHEHEARLASDFSRKTGARIQDSQVIVDVPEEAVFETDLFVRDEGRAFGESSSFFKAETVKAFVKTLRMVRVYIDRSVGPEVRAICGR